MTRPDIVTELDRWLVSRASLHEATVSHALLQGARDEIVALRKLQLANVEGNKWLRDNDERVFLKAIDIACTEARAEALEEAARVCDDMARSNAAYTWPAAAIRALKDKG